MPFEFSIPSPNGQQDMLVEPGSTLIFVGANGGGKSRLAIHIEDALALRAHRISAHRALSLNPDIAKVTERQALSGLRTGHANGSGDAANRLGIRWGGKATFLLNDFDFLIQALFADQSKIEHETHKMVRAGSHGPAFPTKFEQLVEIWQRLLPHRQLHVSGDSIEVAVLGSNDRYPASEMSDGERATFYLIGQALAAASNSLLIFDEPELHIHRSIMSNLLDELEAIRKDCAFALITHDLEFSASRVAQKFVIRDYDPTPYWIIETVPEDSGFDEELTTLILGSRQPILFVEGDHSSLDVAIYRCRFPNWTIVPRGSCEAVIHSVVTMRRNERLTRVTCSGIVDADAHSADEISYLGDRGIAVLPVSEIENVVLLPAVSRAIAASESYEGNELEERLRMLKSAIFEAVSADGMIDSAVTRYCRRRIDNILGKIDLSDAETVNEIMAEYSRQTAALDVEAIAREARLRIEEALESEDLPGLLASYDNKGLMALGARHLKSLRLSDFESWLVRTLRTSKEPALTNAIRGCIPDIRPE